MSNRPKFEIRRAVARLDDPEALAQLLTYTLDREHIAKLLATREAGWVGRYGPESRSADCVISDGASVMRFTVFDVSEDDADAIFRECNAMHDWTDQSFHDMVNRALGTNYVRAQ